MCKNPEETHIISIVILINIIWHLFGYTGIVLLKIYQQKECFTYIFLHIFYTETFVLICNIFGFFIFQIITC